MTDQIKDTDEIPAEVMRLIIMRQIDAHKNGAKEMELLARVNKSIGADAEVIKRHADEAVRLWKIVAALREELAALG